MLLFFFSKILRHVRTDRPFFSKRHFPPFWLSNNQAGHALKLANDARIEYNLQCLQVLLGDRIPTPEFPIKLGWFSLATKVQAQAILRDDRSENEIEANRSTNKIILTFQSIQTRGALFQVLALAKHVWLISWSLCLCYSWAIFRFQLLDWREKASISASTRKNGKFFILVLMAASRPFSRWSKKYFVCACIFVCIANENQLTVYGGHCHNYSIGTAQEHLIYRWQGKASHHVTLQTSWLPKITMGYTTCK